MFLLSQLIINMNVEWIECNHGGHLYDTQKYIFITPSASNINHIDNAPIQYLFVTNTIFTMNEYKFKYTITNII